MVLRQSEGAESRALSFAPVSVSAALPLAFIIRSIIGLQQSGSSKLGAWRSSFSSVSTWVSSQLVSFTLILSLLSS